MRPHARLHMWEGSHAYAYHITGRRMVVACMHIYKKDVGGMATTMHA